MSYTAVILEVNHYDHMAAMTDSDPWETDARYTLEHGDYPRRSMKDFRRAIARYPTLVGLNWEEHRLVGAWVYAYEMIARTSSGKIYVVKYDWDRASHPQDYVEDDP